MKMRCFCVTRHGAPLECIERPVPEPQGTEVLLRVRAAGVCHSDLHIQDGYYDLGGGQRMELAARGIKPPLVLSHEVAGEVVGAGPEAGAVQPGLVALVHPWIGCGNCAVCRRGDEPLCSSSQAIGVVRPGGFADYIVVPHPRYLIPLDGLDPVQAAPLACAGVTTYSALKKFGRLVQEVPVVVIGAGGLGMMALEILKALGGRAVVVDLDAAKRDAALAAGAIAAVDAGAADAAAQLVALTDGGARAVLDLVGAPASVTLAMAASARGGHIVVCGLLGGELRLALPTLPLRPLTLQGSYVGTLDELRELVALMKGASLHAIPITRRPLAEADLALQELRAGRVIGRTVLQP